MLKRLRQALLTATALSVASVSPVFAQNEAARFFLELNSAADTAAGDCRLTYVATNGTQVGLNQAAYEVAVFDSGGIVTRILVLAFGALPEGKTRVVQFDIAGQSCENTSRIVVNDVAECVTLGSGVESVCIDSLATATRAPIQFGL